MATWLAQQIVRKLLATAIIDSGDTELYVYGFFLLISKVLYLCVTLITSTILDLPIAGLVFYISFQLLRGYAGGVHAKTEKSCTILTSLAIIGSVVLIKILLSWESWIIPALMLVGASICIFALSPLDTAEKPLNKFEQKQYGGITRLILCGCLLGILLAWHLDWEKIAYAITVSIILESLLLVVGTYQKHSHPQHSNIAVL